MEFGVVMGLVVASVKDEKFHNKKLLIVQPTDHRWESVGPPFVALDGVGVGVGERVYYETSREAPFAFPDEQPATDASIVGIIDDVDAD